MSLAGIAVLWAAAGGVTMAAGNSQPTGITVTPAYQQVVISQDQAQVPVSFNVTNNKSTVQSLRLSSADFNTLNETGGLFFVGSNPTELQKKYGLAKWLSWPQDQITIQPKQTAIIKASILNLADMPAGGHYGALMLSLLNPGAGGQGNIALRPVASSLLFVTKLGGDTHKLGLSGVTFHRTLFNLPGSVNLRFYNNGNTHLTPRGSVTITTPSGKIVSKGIINDDSGIVLPETFRKFNVPLQTVVHSRMIGKYKIRVDFRFDGINQFHGYQQSFVFVPAAGLIIAAGLVVVAVMLTVVFLKRVKIRRP